MKTNFTTIILILAIVFVGIGVWRSPEPVVPVQGGVNNNLDTSSSQITHSTTTINTTSTQIFSSIAKIGELINDTATRVTCSMDVTGTTAASSTVAAGRGIILYASSSPTGPNRVEFGECYAGLTNCYAHKGAVNCLADVQATATKWSK